MKVSVIIPVYDTEKYLEKCIKSVINQTLKDIEIIIVNDGSPDNSLNIMRFYEKQDDRILVFDTSNQGVHAARNLGIEHAKGEYILFLDSDDYIDPTMLEIAYEQIVKAGTNIAVFNYFLVYDDHISEPYLSLPKSSMIDIQKNDSEYLCRLLKEEVYLGACVFNKLFKTSFIRETGILFESRTKIFAEDAFFYYKLLKKIDKICIIDETLYFYYQRATSASNGYKPDLNKKIETFISELDCYYQFHACYPAIHKSLQMLCFEYFIQVLYNERNHGIAYVSFKKIIKSKFFRNQLIGLSFKEISLKRKLFYLLYRCKMYRLIYRVSKNRKGDDGVC
jgi:Glycosyltransferases involved in cell wall biogenesis